MVKPTGAEPRVIEIPQQTRLGWRELRVLGASNAGDALRAVRKAVGPGYAIEVENLGWSFWQAFTREERPQYAWPGVSVADAMAGLTKMQDALRGKHAEDGCGTVDVIRNDFGWSITTRHEVQDRWLGVWWKPWTWRRWERRLFTDEVIQYPSGQIFVRRMPGQFTCHFGK